LLTSISSHILALFSPQLPLATKNQVAGSPVPLSFSAQSSSLAQTVRKGGDRGYFSPRAHFPGFTSQSSEGLLLKPTNFVNPRFPGSYRILPPLRQLRKKPVGASRTKDARTKKPRRGTPWVDNRSGSDAQQGSGGQVEARIEMNFKEARKPDYKYVREED